MVVFLLTAVILILLVLIQRGRGGGLAGAFGGPGGHSAFGTKTADVFTRATAVVGGIFFILSIVTALIMRSGEATPPPETPAAPAPAQPGAATDSAAPTGAAETGGSGADTKPADSKAARQD